MILAKIPTVLETSKWTSFHVPSLTGKVHEGHGLRGDGFEVCLLIRDRGFSLLFVLGDADVWHYSAKIGLLWIIRLFLTSTFREFVENPGESLQSYQLHEVCYVYLRV